MNNRILYIPKEKKYTKKKISRSHMWVAFGLVLGIGIIAASVALMRIPALHIQKISFTGLHTIREQDLRQEIDVLLAGSYAAGLIPYRFFFAVPAEKFADIIRHTFPLIAEIAIEKKFPNELNISLRERVMFSILCNDAMSNEISPSEETPLIEERTPEKKSEEKRSIQCAYVDTEGFAYEEAPYTQGFLIIRISTDRQAVTIGERMIDERMMQRIMDINSKLPSVIKSPLVNYTLIRDVPREVRVMSKQGFSLFINRDDDLDHELEVLGALLEKEIGAKRRFLDYIDLRFGNKVFYKFKQ